MKASIVVILAAVAIAISMSALGVTWVSARTQVQSSFGNVPGVISYQGFLTDSKGETLGEVRQQVTFRIYSDPGDIRPRWEEVHTVTTSQGAFSVLLGSREKLDPEIFAESVAYLGVQVGDDAELQPRQVLSSVPFAMISGQATQAQSLSCTGCITSRHLASDAVTSSSSGSPTRMVSPNGEFSVDVTDGGIVLAGPAGTIVISEGLISVDASGIRIVSTADILLHSNEGTLVSSESDIDIQSDGKTHVKATGNATFESLTDVDILAGTTANVRGDAGVRLGTGGIMDIDGSLITLNGTCDPVARRGDAVVVPSNVSGTGLGTITTGSALLLAC